MQMPKTEPMEQTPMAAAPRMARVAVPQASGAFGVALFLPLIAVIYAAIVVTAGIRGIAPGILKSVEKTQFGGLGLIWYLVIGFSIVTLIVVATASMSGSGPKAQKKTKNKPKKKKKKK